MKNAYRGDHIDFAAPGVDVWSARADGSGRYYTGTSFAAPFVTAMMALALHDAGNGGEALARLRESVLDLGEPDPTRYSDMGSPAGPRTALTEYCAAQ